MMARREVKLIVATLLGLGSIALMALSFLGRVPYDPKEAIGFVTGAWGVYLVILENVWNWPIGVISSAFYVVVFAETRLFGDMGLNVLYVILGVLGWYWWLRGGTGRASVPSDDENSNDPRKEGAKPGHGRELAMSALDLRGWMLSLVALIVLTAGFTLYFHRIGDSSPFLDALTTALSLVAQVLLTRKVVENWIFWIVADAIYVPLYLSRNLTLTAVLYALFFVMAIAGFLEWRRKHRASLAPLHA